MQVYGIVIGEMRRQGVGPGLTEDLSEVLIFCRDPKRVKHGVGLNRRAGLSGLFQTYWAKVGAPLGSRMDPVVQSMWGL